MKDRRFERKTLIDTDGPGGGTAPAVSRGAPDTEIFIEYVKTFPFLMPACNRDSILILDNCSPHKSKKSLECLAECGIKYRFLPPYSPDYMDRQHLLHNSYLNGILSVPGVRVARPGGQP